MSNLVFPPVEAAIGLAWNNSKTPLYKTLIKEAASGNEHRLGMWVFPRYKFSWQFKILKQDGTAADQLRNVVSFFLRHNASFDSFLIRDTEDNELDDQVIAIGDGVQDKFRIVRSYLGFVEPVAEIDATTLVVKLDAVTKILTTHYTYDGKGVINFVTAPADDAEISVSCTFYFRVRFNTDEMPFSQFLSDYWRTDEIPLISCKGE